MRVLVIAATKHGSTAEIAAALGEALAHREIVTAVVDAGDVQDLEGYDAVVLGSAVYAGHWLKPAKELVDRHRQALASRPVWLFSVGPVGDPPRPEEEPADVAAIAAATAARGHRIFAGKIDKSGMGLAEKAVVKALRVPEGDYRNWDEVAAWAGEIADALQGATSR